MPGALVSVVAKGVQDSILTSIPEITFFEGVFKAYVDFGVEAIEHQFSGSADFGRTCAVTLSRNGDLVTRCVLEAILPAVSLAISNGLTGCSQVWYQWAQYIGQTMINYVTLKVGAQDIDKQYGQWMNVWTDMSLEPQKHLAHLRMIGQQNPFFFVSFAIGADNNANVNYTSDAVLLLLSGLQSRRRLHAQTKVIVPVKFWFWDHALALPQVAMPFAETRMEFVFRNYTDLYFLNTGPTSGTGPNSLTANNNVLNKSLVAASLWVDHVFVDNEERLRIVNDAHEYLIRQVGFNNENTVSSGTTALTTDLNFNHPVCSLYWFVQMDSLPASDTTTSERLWATYYNASSFNPCSAARVTANAGDRYATRSSNVHDLLNPYFHHSAVATCARLFDNLREGQNTTSFSLYPEDFQPSGSMNFSRLDKPQLIQTLYNITASKIYVYSLNINTFRVGNGTAGLGFTA